MTFERDRFEMRSLNGSSRFDRHDFRELEREGLVEGRQGIGTFVLRRPDGPPPGTHALLSRGLVAWITKARRAGLRDADIESMVRSTLALAETEATA